MGFIAEAGESKNGKMALTVAGVALVLVAGYFMMQSMGADPVEDANGRVFMDSKTNKTFRYTLRAGDTVPIKAPSGGQTGYPTEICNWTADGKVSPTITYVLLNQAIGQDGPTFCPDCGRLVVAHNPGASTTRRPPPTKAEYEKPKSR